MKINIGKTEVMGVTKGNEEFGGKGNYRKSEIKQIRSFKYLASLVSENGKCDAEIRSKIALGES